MIIIIIFRALLTAESMLVKVAGVIQLKVCGYLLSHY